MQTLRKYLRTHAEPEANIAAAVTGRFGHMVIIPAHGEGASLHAALASLRRGPCGDVLAIVVINARADAPPWAHQANADAWERLTAGATPLPAPPGTLAQFQGATPWGALLCIGRHTPGAFLPPGQGVGLARKIGTDVALALYAAGQLADPWLHHTDADALLPADYFARTLALPRSVVAAVYPFVHTAATDDAVGEAARRYEISLRYYVLGLRHAGSPYAFHTIGSTVAVRAEAYAQVRGVPKRDAAEDFYFLDKLRKVGTVVSLSGAPLILSGRVSQRVPFGTGKAIWRLVSGDLPALRLYHPATFDYLRAWLQILADVAVTGACPLAQSRDADVPEPTLLTEVIRRLDAAPAVAAAQRQGHAAATRTRFLHTWFDAFRTLRFVHTLRDLALPLQDLDSALAQAAFAAIPVGTSTGEARAALAQKEAEG